ncbi:MULTISPECIES: cell division protein DedD [Arsenophonus]|uniref:cell division protein DedD n=1 Tax=Arsenophonus TaxID=637 RepID=UPI0015D7F7A2|nr:MULTISPECIES: cell division protein DedD [Arsenophonus]UBX29959.1 cell division protein DedD [Arsenophonus apicola]
MASKFQNRLVGTIVIVAVGVIILPVLLDGNKKYNETEFAAIPLVPKASDEYEIEPIAPINPKPLVTPSESAAQAMISAAISDSKAKIADSQSTQQQTKSKAAAKVEKSALEPEQNTKSNEKTQAPQGRAYVIQLGVLKNAAKVEEIIARLRLSGYQVYTEPTIPVNGQLTRIFIGPNASREKLQSSLPELKDLTGLQGQIRSYKP